MSSYLIDVREDMRRREIALQLLLEAHEDVGHYTRLRAQRIREALAVGCSYRSVGAAVDRTAGAIHARYRSAD